MGVETNFKVNNDGSVTVTDYQDENEKAILDILRIENAKGGIFASLRMKRRAKKFAKSQDIPNYEMLVDRLMLDNYPKDFGNYAKARNVLIWRIIAIVILLLTGWVILAAAHSDRVSLNVGIVFPVLISGALLWYAHRIAKGIKM